MKVSLVQLSGHLAAGLKPIYFISGDEPLLLEEASTAIRKAVYAAGFSERSLMHVEKGFNWTQFLMEANTFSLFNNKILVEVRLGTAKLTDAATEALQKYAQDPAPDKILLLIGSKQEAATWKSAWVLALDKVGVIVQLWPIKPAELPGWIKQRLQNAGFQADSAAIRLLVERGEGNLLALNQAIQKLGLLYAPGKLGAPEIAEVLSDSAHFDIFALAEAAKRSDKERLIKVFQGLKQEGAEPLLILWALAREVRNSQASSRQKLLQQTSRVDAILKGALPGNGWDELLQLALAVAGVTLFPTREN